MGTFGVAYYPGNPLKNGNFREQKEQVQPLSRLSVNAFFDVQNGTR